MTDLSNLEWRAVVGAEDRYQVSERGQVRRTNSCANKRAGSLLAAHVSRGRPRYFIYYGQIKRSVFAHTLVCEVWHGPKPSASHQVAHWDGDKSNNHYSNLRWATPAENGADKTRHGASGPVGESHGMAKLSEADVLEIRRLYKTGQTTQKALAIQFGLSQPGIGLIIRKEKWAWLDEDYAFRRVPVSSVEPDPDQPRKDFDPALLKELAASIAQVGLMQPITVIDLGDGKFRLIAGERRWRAHKLLNWETIRVKVVQRTQLEISVEALVENIQRSNLNPFEEAHAYKRLLDQGYTVEGLAKSIGLSQPWRITQRVHLLKLEPQIQALARSGAISLNAAYEIAKLEAHLQTQVVRSISQGSLKTDNQVASAVAAILANLSQDDMFGGAPDPREIDTLNRMEQKILSVEKLVASGWADNECVIATKVNPSRAALMAEKLKLIRTAIGKMERELQNTGAQRQILLECA